MRKLLLKSITFVIPMLLAGNFLFAAVETPNDVTAAENIEQKIELKEKTNDKLTEINSELEANKTNITIETNKLPDLQEKLKAAMKALSGNSNSFFTPQQAEAGDLSVALDRLLRRSDILGNLTLSNQQLKDIQDKIVKLEKAILELRNQNLKLSNLENEQAQLVEKKKAIEDIPSVLDQEKDLEINAEEKNKDNKNSELVDLTKKITTLYDANESILNADPENDFTNLATLIQVYSKNIKRMEGAKSLDSIETIGKELEKERDAFLTKLGRKTGREVDDITFGKVDANFNSIRASQTYRQIFGVIDSDLAKIEETKDIPQIIRAYKAVQLGLLGIKKMEDAREFTTKPGSTNQTTSDSSKYYYTTPNLNIILSTNPKHLKHMLKLRRKNTHIYYKYR